MKKPAKKGQEGIQRQLVERSEVTAEQKPRVARRVPPPPSPLCPGLSECGAFDAEPSDSVADNDPPPGEAVEGIAGLLGL